MNAPSTSSPPLAYPRTLNPSSINMTAIFIISSFPATRLPAKPQVLWNNFFSNDPPGGFRLYTLPLLNPTSTFENMNTLPVEVAICLELLSAPFVQLRFQDSILTVRNRCHATNYLLKQKSTPPKYADLQVCPCWGTLQTENTASSAAVVWK